MLISIIIPGEPIRVTEQQHRYGGRKKSGQAIIYRGARLERARETLLEELRPYVTDSCPMKNAICLSVTYAFPTKDKRLYGQYKKTRPDTDNMVKLLKDCITRVGIWKDDSQVASEHILKMWTSDDEACTAITIREIGGNENG